MRCFSEGRNRYSIAGIALLALLVATAASFADPPAAINVRGQLLDAQGHALSGARAYRVQFYDAGTAGAALGTPFTGLADVSLEGLFNLEVTLPAQVLMSPQAWYEVAVSISFISTM